MLVCKEVVAPVVVLANGASLYWIKLLRELQQLYTFLSGGFNPFHIYCYWCTVHGVWQFKAVHSIIKIMWCKDLYPCREAQVRDFIRLSLTGIKHLMQHLMSISQTRTRTMWRSAPSDSTPSDRPTRCSVTPKSEHGEACDWGVYMF